MSISWQQKRRDDKTRLAEGWLTVLEIAALWECSDLKAVDILLESGAESKWEFGNIHAGRRLFRLPKKLSRNPHERKNHARHKRKIDDWLMDVPDKRVVAKVRDERKKRLLIGTLVTVTPKTKAAKDEPVTGILLYYNQISFGVYDKRNRRTLQYKTRDSVLIPCKEMAHDGDGFEERAAFVEEQENHGREGRGLDSGAADEGLFVADNSGNGGLHAEDCVGSSKAK